MNFYSRRRSFQQAKGPELVAARLISYHIPILLLNFFDPNSVREVKTPRAVQRKGRNNFKGYSWVFTTVSHILQLCGYL